MTTPAPFSLCAAIHDEVARRAEAWRDAIATATGEARHSTIGKAASDLTLWRMIGDALGWNQRADLPQIEIRGQLALALQPADQAPHAESAEDWARMLRNAQATLDRARAQDDGGAAMTAKIRALRHIHTELARASALRAARTPQPHAPQKEAA